MKEFAAETHFHFALLSLIIKHLSLSWTHDRLAKDYTIDPWTTWGLGASIPDQSKISLYLYSRPSVSTVLHHGFNQPWIVQYVWYIFNEQSPCITGPTQFKLILFKGQLYFPVSLAARCDHVTKFWRLGYKWKRYVPLLGRAYKKNGWVALLSLSTHPPAEVWTRNHLRPWPGSHVLRLAGQRDRMCLELWT